MKTKTSIPKILFFSCSFCLMALFAGAQTNKAYDDNMKLIDSVFVGPGYQYIYAIYSGDIDQDGQMDISDFNIMEIDVTAFATGYIPSDINGDLRADVSDFNLLEANVTNFVKVHYPH